VSAGGWRERSACAEADPRLFLDGRGYRKALRICADCPVWRECLEYALVNAIEDGIWGATTPPLRRLMLAIRIGEPDPEAPADDALWQRASCGSESGYQAHRYRGEARCDPCKKAHAAHVSATTPRTVRRRCEHCGRVAKLRADGSFMRHVGCPVHGKTPTRRGQTPAV
jgi:hypothetical protein